MRPGPLRIGQDFGPRYHVLKLLGSGGMGVVYQALDHELNVEIALKVLRAPARTSAAVALSVTEMQRRFKTELLLARKITHRNVIRIHDIGEIDGIRFISMPLVVGRDLATILKTGALPAARVLRYARQIAAGLAAVHAAGVIHRDLKPANLMIDEEDEALLMDFGIARSNAPAAQQRTMGGAVVGTAAYMAPEQARGEAVDQRTDIYAFGLILYEMAYGPRPAITMADLVGRMKAAPQPERQFRSAVPDGLHAIITRCLQPAAGDRYQTTVELAAALATVSSRRRRPAGAANRWASRAAAILLLAALASLAYWTTTRRGIAAVAQGRLVVTRSLEAMNPARLFQSQQLIASGVADRSPAAPPAARAGAAAASPHRASVPPPHADKGEYLAGASPVRATHDPQSAGLAASYLAVADARATKDTVADTVQAIYRALDVSRDDVVLLAAARLFATVERPDQARALARELSARGGRGHAYAGLIEGEIQFGSCRAR